MAGFGEIAIGEDVAGAEMNEMSSRSKLTCHSHDIVVGPCRETASAECQSVMRIGHGIEEPADILSSTHDTR